MTDQTTGSMGFRLQKLGTQPPTLDHSEWYALWEWHVGGEKSAAVKGHYEEAQYHRARAAVLAVYISPADQWERAWSNQQ